MSIESFKTILFTFVLVCLLASCTTLSSGKKYTLAKVNRSKQLIEPHRVFESEEQSDMLDQVNPKGVLGIVLNSGYLPYLQEVGRPEVAIFVTTKIRSKTEPEEELLWERVYLNSESEGTYIAVNKDSFLPRKDITVLPPIIYEGQEILVSIRIIEMDQADNERMKTIVATAAAAAATFQPQYAGAISVFQNLLNLIISANSDDIEFQFDFALSKNPGPFTYRGNHLYDMVLTPRIAKYGVIKTEHRERAVIPNGYADAAQNGLRYTVAEILKFGTLGILNWPIWCDWSKNCNDMNLKEQDDIYHKILGRPFNPQQVSFIPPIFENGLLSSAHHSGNFEIVGSDIKVRQTDGYHDFEDQGYMIFSVVADNTGVDIKSLKTIANQRKVIENLNLNTLQLGPKDLKKHMDPVLTSVKGMISIKDIRQSCTGLINEAKTKEQVDKEKDKCEKRLKDIETNLKFGDTLKLASEYAKQKLSQTADRQLDRIKKGEK